MSWCIVLGCTRPYFTGTFGHICWTKVSFCGYFVPTKGTSQRDYKLVPLNWACLIQALAWLPDGIPLGMVALHREVLLNIYGYVFTIQRRLHQILCSQ